MKHFSARSLLLPVVLFVSLPAAAHEGHGLLGGHWHASDAFGFVALALVVGVAVWISRK
jgi:hypothetical protein